MHSCQKTRKINIDIIYNINPKLRYKSVKTKTQL